MKFEYIIIFVIITFPLFCFGQETKAPKNLKKAVFYLNQVTSDSLKGVIRGSVNDTIKRISYPWGGDFKLIYKWTDRDGYSYRLIKYLDKKGVSHHQIEVVLLAFKALLNKGAFNEDKLLEPFRKIELKWRQEDQNRYSADSLRWHYIPKDIKDCIRQIDRLWDNEAKLKYFFWSEDNFAIELHHGFGRWTRNYWQLWGGSRLSKYFNDMGVFHPDDMSSIILVSYHRHLNGKAIELDKQTKYYQEFWEKSKQEDLKEREREQKENESYFSEFQIGDTLEFNYNYDFVSKAQEDEWRDDVCLARGVLLKKDKASLKLKVRLIQSCDKKGIVYYHNYEERVFDKKTKRWIRPKKKVRKLLKQGRSRWFELDDWELE